MFWKQDVSSEFIKEYNHLYTTVPGEPSKWSVISAYQKLSIDFIKENFSILDKYFILNNKKYSEEELKLIQSLYDSYGDLL